MTAIIFDTEASGLVENRTLRLDRQPYVTEFYGEEVDLDTGEVKQEFQQLFKIPVALDEKITKITGITDEMLKDSATFNPQVIDFLESGPMVIAHNLSFDKDMIEIECQRLGRVMKWPTGLCTVEQTIGMRGFRLTLSRLHEELFKENFAGSHRAREDVKALTRCCLELRKRGII